MAKKKKLGPEEDLDDEFDDFEDEEIETVYPEIEKKPTEKKETIEGTSEIDAEEYEEDLDYELEEEPEIPTYKYLDLNLTEGMLENDYELDVIGQSHGFCNIFVKHLLNIKGVNAAAYKYTRIDPAKIFIRLEPGYEIKKILHKGIESLREDVLGVKELFQKLL